MKKDSFSSFRKVATVALVLIGLVFAGCEKMELPKENKFEENEVITDYNSDKEIILGGYIGMANSTYNIKKSMIKLGYNSKADNIETNALYIKIKPITSQEIEYIDTSTSFVIYDYPLDYEIIQEGDYYIEPEITDTFYNPRYAIIEKNQDIPEYLNYEIKDELYIPQTEEEAAAYLYSQLLLGQIELPENTDTIEYIEENKGGWYPNLKIQLQNSNGTIQNMSFMKIRIGVHYYNTDAYRVVQNTKKHYGQIKVDGRFQNNIATVRKGYVEFIGVDRYDLIKKVNPSSQQITITITKTNNPVVWDKATVFGSLIKYNNFCSNNGIQQANNLNVWISSTFSGGSCPLFHRLSGVEFGLLQTYLQTFILGISLSTSAIISLISHNLVPDITIDKYSTTKDYDLTSFHELSHFSHAVKRGRAFWQQVVIGEIENTGLTFGDPYGDGTQPSQTKANYIGLAESWAYYMEGVIGRHYNYPWDSSFPNRETFQPRTIPSESFASNGWIPVGLFWDIRDNNSDLIELQNADGTIIILSGNDNINGISSGITISNLYNIITNSNCNSIVNFKTLFNNQYPNLTTQNNLLFSYYGY